jgi:hypothetical protein
MGLPPRQVQVRVPISELKDRVCPKCQGMLFIQMMALKELPPVYSPSGQYETNMSLVGFGCGVRNGHITAARAGEGVGRGAC